MDNVTLGSTISLIQTAGLPSGSAFPIGTTTNTFVATDAAGNSSTCSFTVTVNDTQAPVITCPSNITTVATSAAGATVSYTTPVGTDNCIGSVTARTAGLASGDTFPIGTTTVTHTVTDAAGIATSCSFDVKVVGIPPVVVCPENVILAAESGKCGATVSYAATETTAIPASAISYSHVSGSFFPVGTTVVTATATNAVGVSTCSFTITIKDTQAPQLVGIPVNQTVECNAVPAAAIVTATDNCEFAGVVSYNEVRTDGSCPSAYTLTRTWSTKDAAGNTTTASQVITVEDTQAPVLTIPQSIAVNNDLGVCGAVATYVAKATDNCDAPVITYSHTSGTVFNVGTTTVTVTAKDACGNTSSGTFTVTVTDNEKPSITAPAAIAQNNDATHCYATVNLGTTTTRDNCGVASVSNDAPATFPVGSTTVTWTVTDIHGNSNTATQVVTVTDNEKPVLTCVSNQSKMVDHAVCAYEVKGTEFNATAIDNCGVRSLSYTISGATSGNGTSLAGVLFNKGISTVTWTTVDIHGNVSTCSYTVTVTSSLAVTVADNNVLMQGSNANTIYTGYTPASVLKLTAASTGGGSGYTYQWSVPAGFSLVNGSATQQTAQITSTIAGDYSGVVSLTVTDIFGCTTTTTKTIQVKDVRCGTKNDKVLVCHNTGSAKNPWVQVCVAPSAVATHLANGGYLGACNIATITSNDNVKPAVEAKTATVLAYPNPSRGIVSLRLSNFTAGKVTVQVMDGNGKLVSVQSSSVSYTTEDVSIDLSRVAGGVYQIKVLGDKEMLMTKVVIAR